MTTSVHVYLRPQEYHRPTTCVLQQQVGYWFYSLEILGEFLNIWDEIYKHHCSQWTDTVSLTAVYRKCLLNGICVCTQYSLCLPLCAVIRIQAAWSWLTETAVEQHTVRYPQSCTRSQTAIGQKQRICLLKHWQTPWTNRYLHSAVFVLASNQKYVK